LDARASRPPARQARFQALTDLRVTASVRAISPTSMSTSNIPAASKRSACRPTRAFTDSPPLSGYLMVRTCSANGISSPWRDLAKPQPFNLSSVKNHYRKSLASATA
jgi:hypothetical protein